MSCLCLLYVQDTSIQEVIRLSLLKCQTVLLLQDTLDMGLGLAVVRDTGRDMDMDMVHATDMDMNMDMDIVHATDMDTRKRRRTRRRTRKKTNTSTKTDTSMATVTRRERTATG